MSTHDISLLYEDLEPTQLIDLLLTDAKGPACITCSFQAEDVMVLHLLRRRVPDIAVLFLDTGYHFAETYAFRDRLTKEWNLKLVNLTAEQTVAEQEAQFGKLYRSDPGACCHRRKVEPLMKGLEPFALWFTGLRREQSPTRRNLKAVERHQLPSGRELVKASPLAGWKWQQVWDYTTQHELTYLPLYDLGYPSIGCEPCTSKPAEGADPRSGRWGGVKLECGIHTFSKRAE
jgi:phosphoadenosine phosphosulfate reductase